MIMEAEKFKFYCLQAGDKGEPTSTPSPKAWEPWERVQSKCEIQKQEETDVPAQKTERENSFSLRRLID